MSGNDMNQILNSKVGAFARTLGLTRAQKIRHLFQSTSASIKF